MHQMHHAPTHSRSGWFTKYMDEPNCIYSAQFKDGASIELLCSIDRRLVSVVGRGSKLEGFQKYAFLSRCSSHKAKIKKKLKNMFLIN